jgi:hypothetical protein
VTLNATTSAQSAASSLASEVEPEGGCLPNTLVRMADGSERPIEDVRPDQCVVTADGRTGTVRHTITRRENESIVRLTLRGHTPVSLASQHVVLTENGEVAVRDLMLDDHVALTRFLPAARAALEIDEVISRRERAMKGGALRGGALQGGASGEPAKVVPIAPIPDAIPLTPRTGRLIGLFLAYGAIDESRVRWTFGGEERDALVTQCADLLTDLGIRAEIEPQFNARVSVTVYGGAWARLWTRLFERRDQNRTVHPLLLGDGDYLRAMLAGWAAGEGYSGRSFADSWHMRGSTVSRTLAMSLYDIALGLGFRPMVRLCAATQNVYPKRSKPFYEIELVMPFERPDHSDNAGTTAERGEKESVVKPVHVWARVRGIEQCRFAGAVYSLNVDGGESYVAEGIGVRCSANRGAPVAQQS